MLAAMSTGATNGAGTIASTASTSSSSSPSSSSSSGAFTSATADDSSATVAPAAPVVHAMTAETRSILNRLLAVASPTADSAMLKRDPINGVIYSFLFLSFFQTDGGVCGWQATFGRPVNISLATLIF